MTMRRGFGERDRERELERREEEEEEEIDGVGKRASIDGLRKVSI